jgi:alpha-glucosidase (family GH31 glycosyl hydrolase)
MNMDAVSPIDLNTEQSRLRIHYLTPHAVRVIHAPLFGINFPTDRPWLEQVLLPQVPVMRDEIYCYPQITNGCLMIRGMNNEMRFSEAKPVTFWKDQVELAIRINKGESFYGWGEWFNAFQRTSGKIELQNRESISLVQSRQTYSTIPFFISSRNYAFWLLNSHKSTWEIQPETGMIRIKADGLPVDYVVIFGSTPAEILANYTELSGRPPLLPRWAFGLWLTSYPQEDQTRVVEIVAQHRHRKVPLDAIILDYHWEQRFHNFKWRSSLFPDPQGMIGQLKANHIHLGLIFTPYLNHTNEMAKKRLLDMAVHNVPKGLIGDDERALLEYEQADKANYLAHGNVSWWFGAGGMVDFTNPGAVKWWNDKLKPLYDMGVDFFNTDDGEYLPENAESHLGINGKEYHNLYGFFYGKAIYESMLELDNRRPMVYARSVWAGSQRFPALFLGDQKPDFENIQRTLRAGLNMSLAGFAYWTADVFGLDGRTTPETHMRYAQWALLSPIARYFIRPESIDNTRFPWSHNAAVEANFCMYVQLRYRLLPYYYQLAWAAFKTGLPIVRPMLLEFPSNPRMWQIEDQYMLGPSLLVAPVVQPGATSRRVALPEGEWYEFWSSKRISGGREINFPVKADLLPILVRAGTILPMGPPLEFISSEHTFASLELHFWPPFSGKMEFFEDDGMTRDYLDGIFSSLPIQASQDGSKVEIKIGPVFGKYPGELVKRKIKFVFHDVLEPKKVSVNGIQSSTGIHNLKQRQLLVAVEVHAHAPNKLNIEF